MALRCLNAAASIDAEHPRVHEQAVAFSLALKQTSDLPPKVSEVLKANFNLIKESPDLKSFNEAFVNRHNDSLDHRLAGIKVKKLLGEDKSAVEKELFGLLSLPGAAFEDAVKGLETLKSWRSGEVAGYKKAAQEKWPGVTRLL